MHDSPFRWYLGFLARYKAGSAAVVFLITVAVFLGMLQPLFLLIITNEALRKSNLNLLLAIVTAMIATGVAAQYAYGIAKHHRARLGQRILADLRRSVLDHVLKQPPAYFATHPRGELVATLSHEIDALDPLHHVFFFGVGSIAAFGLGTVVCFWIDPVLTVILVSALATIPLFLWLERKTRGRMATALRHEAGLIRFLERHLGHVTTTQAFGREASDLRRLESVAQDLAEARSGVEGMVQLSFRTFDIVRVVIPGGILLAGAAWAIRGGSPSLGVLLAVHAYAQVLLIEAKDVVRYLLDAGLACVPLRRIHDRLRTDLSVRLDPRQVSLTRADGCVEFEQVWFRHAPDRPYVLKEVSFRAEPGTLVAIVGLSGSGKSSLFQLLLRFHEATRGTVRLDGHDVKDLRLSDLRAQFGLAAQDAVLFEGTLADNIRCGRETAGDEEVLAAAREAMVHEFVHKLPDGLQTSLASDALPLSGGERQRIALARVFLKGAPVLLLDEASAGLDARTEACVQRALEAKAPDHTILMVTHRLSTVLRADQILVMDGGRIVQRGTHAQLLAQADGLYRFLYDRQLAESSGFREVRTPASAA